LFLLDDFKVMTNKHLFVSPNVMRVYMLLNPKTTLLINVKYLKFDKVRVVFYQKNIRRTTVGGTF
jgi:hypothetical protein